jgi:UDP-N-acetylglucosamine transferase subunit ALG13
VSTFISVGNATQPFDRLLQAVASCLADLPQPVFVQHGSGKNIFEGACNSTPFVTMDEFSKYIQNAQLLILHGGAGSIINAVRAGKVPVVMPRRYHLNEHIDDHQVELANELALNGKIIVCEDASKLLNAAGQAIQLQSQTGSRMNSIQMIWLVRQALTNF